MADVMEFLGVALCYVLAAGVLIGWIALVVAARMEIRKERMKHGNP